MSAARSFTASCNTDFSSEMAGRLFIFTLYNDFCQCVEALCNPVGQDFLDD